MYQCKRNMQCFFQVGILVYSLLFGRVDRLLNGYDDYGNTCGVKNFDHALANVSQFTNMDMRDRK